MIKRSSFLIVISIIGLVLWAFTAGYVLSSINYPQQVSYETYRDAEDERLPSNQETTRNSVPIRLRYREPCQQPMTREQSDLCAQWKAARAAEAGIWWAAGMFWISVFGTLITTCGTALLLRTIIQGEAGINESRRSNMIAQDTAKRQLRAYIAVKEVGFFESQEPDDPFTLQLRYENYGETPAEEIYTQFRARIISGRSIKGVKVDIPPRMSGGSLGRLPKGVTEVNTCIASLFMPDGAPVPLSTSNVIDNILDGKFVVVGLGWIIYADAFGDRHYVNFRWFCDQESALKGAWMLVDTFDNDAGECQQCQDSRDHLHSPVA